VIYDSAVRIASCVIIGYGLVMGMVLVILTY